MRERIRELNRAPIREGADYVLYWSQMNRRVDSNHALVYAAQLANRRNLPLLYYEGLTCTYREANDRMHTFVLQGVPETERRLKRLGIGYVFYLRRRKPDANDALYRLAERAAAVVTDDYPTFIAAAHNRSVPSKIGVAYVAVDSSCIVPMNKHEKREYAAYTIRPKIRRWLPEYLKPVEPVAVQHKWGGDASNFHTKVTSKNIPELVASCEIDHAVPPSLAYAGGGAAAEKHLDRFLRDALRRYARERNEPSQHCTSNLSPYLHFGQISSLEVALRTREYAREHRLIADEFLEELIVRRELAFNFSRFAGTGGANLESLEVLPDWCKRTMQKHARDRRDPSYTPERLERAETYDPLWNATQKELLLRGKIHGYYRMYWGKKIIEWSPTYEEALATMIRLHDRYALDGRDPNTYTNILWCFGLHDRPWGERPIFGMLRYMSFDGMKRKTDIGAYMEEIAEIEKSGKDRYRI
ncbi:MAG: deoxyribodipyrimidine photo-lyase [Acidobacteriota bacterium]|nr:deoxyribodipyrimidine photo-lyase [Acidobacteriota bacterium]